jgi:hypothetical protein
VSAIDTFESFNNSLSRENRRQLGDFAKAIWADLLAARSEDERLRLVQNYILEVLLIFSRR